jgi:hypothetical protein
MFRGISWAQDINLISMGLERRKGLDGLYGK